MSQFFVWLVKLACLAGSALSTWYFLETMFPPSLFSIVPIGWACFEVGVLLWPKYAFSRDVRTWSQRASGVVMAFVSYLGCATCFVGNVLMLGPDHALFAMTDSMKAFVVYIVVGDILLTILACMLVTSVLPYIGMLDKTYRHLPRPQPQSRLVGANQDFNLIDPEDTDIQVDSDDNQLEKPYTHNGPAEKSWGGPRQGSGRKGK